MKSFNFILAFSLFLVSFPMLAQNDFNDFDLEEFIESNFSVQDDDTNYEDVYEALFQLYQSPVNLNQANRQDLQSLLVLSNIQINAFLNYRNTNGKFLSIYELQAIPEFDLNTIYNLLPFVDIREGGLQSDNRPLLKRILSEENNYLIIRADRTLEEKRGYTSSDEREHQYLGDPNRLYARFRVKHTNDFSLGFTAEKDAGEQFAWDTKKEQYGMDFFSFHFQLQNQGKLKNIVLGDYQMQFGQSLIFGAGFAVGKGSETVATARRSNLGILPYTSVLETNYFRGLAATYELSKQIDLTTFYSYNSVNGNVDLDSAQSAEEFFTSIRLTGFHRTEAELAGKNAIQSQNFGGNLLFHNTSEDLNIGLNYIQTVYDRDFIRNPKKYNQFEFSGKVNRILGLFANYYWRNFHFFGESAISQSQGVGAIGGFIASISPSLQTSFILRNYDRDFHSFYGTSFGESTRNINEQGVYWGIKFQPSKKFIISSYYDRFTFPWLRFRADGPSKGNEYLGRITYNFNRNISLYGQARVESKERNLNRPENPNIYGLATAQKRNYIVNLDIRPKSLISIKSRIQFSEFLFDNEYTTGMALIQDINFDFGKLRLSTRYAIFDTEDFENRQYVYEKDVLYAFSIPAYQNTGTRTYALLQYKLSKKLQIWARWAQFKYLDAETIGTGNEQIEGNTRSEVKLQMMYKI
ncbi:helix-hairpin-helix domain-containing protein [Marivirga sp. S37H4]|uniref:Helix-hairpin-helix domain-containing protein n=1 Tax=Marivirga aurantiaca TaxID=2802615 RepID=A0A934WXB5_9BACT|nr:helix-hairpin-helix domain-containing protein [Marivirga aurantiaca]MBK6264647.1 helix-hairpin-helix domain-containing protein [Marivirga aurantiaca]